MSPAREELFRRTQRDMMDQSLDPKEITRRYQEYVKELGPAMAKEASGLGESIGAVNLATGGLGNLTKMLESTLELGLKGQADFNSKLPNVVENTERLSKSQDKLRETTGDVQVAFKNYQAQLIVALTKPAEQMATQGVPGGPEFLANKNMMKQLDDNFGLTVAGLNKVGIMLENIPTSIQNAANTIAEKSGSIFLDIMKGITTRNPNPSNPNVNATTPNVEYARGGVLRGPDSGYQSGATFHGNEAVIPLGSGDTIAVDLRSPSGLIESAVQKAQDQAGMGNKSTEAIQTALQTLFDSPNLMTRSMLELKQQLASDNQMSQSIMKQYTDKMDTLIDAVNYNEDLLKRIADNTA
jgi:hypothetical protein